METKELPALQVHENKRFLKTADGAPFFWLGDTAWCLYKMAPAEVDQYMENRARKKYTVVQAMAIRTHGGMDNYHGDEPFESLSPVKLSETYWKHIDYIVDKAAENGMYAALATMWGHNANTLFPNPAQDNQDYGRLLGERYKDRNNVIWLVAGEYGKIRDDWAQTKDEGLTEEHINLFRAIAHGLRDGHGGKHLMTIHPIFSSSRHFHEDAWLDFNMEQTWLNFRACPGRVTEDYGKKPPKPAVNGEPGYEGMGRPDLEKETITPWIARAQAYWCVFSGAFGHTYGSNGLWQFSRPPREPSWTDAMAREGGAHMQHVRALMESVAFPNMAPDQELITSANGTAREKTYIAALRDEAGAFAFVYLPQGGTVSVDLAKLKPDASFKVRWFDPRTGAYKEGHDRDGGAPADFEAPSSGENQDWVLTLKAG